MESIQPSGSVLRIAALAAVLGLVAPFTWLAFVHYCYEPQLPLTAQGPLPPPRFVDHSIRYAFMILWPAAALLMPTTVPHILPSRSEFCLACAGLLLANAVLYATVACLVCLVWSRRPIRSVRL